MESYCHFKDMWKSPEFSVKAGPGDGADFMISGSVLSVIEGEGFAKCLVCRVAFSVCHGGVNDVVKHLRITCKRWHRLLQLICWTSWDFGAGRQPERPGRSRKNSRCRYKERSVCLYSLWPNVLVTTLQSLLGQFFLSHLLLSNFNAPAPIFSLDTL